MNFTRTGQTYMTCTTQYDGEQQIKARCTDVRAVPGHCWHTYQIILDIWGTKHQQSSV